MIAWLLSVLGYSHVAEPLIEAIPLAEAMLCVGCEAVTRPTRHGSCPLCGTGSLVFLQTSILNREDRTEVPAWHWR